MSIGGPKVIIPIPEAAVLLYNVYRGSDHPQVGYEESRMTMVKMSEYFSNRGMLIPKEIVESALWSSNLLDEVGEFWHPQKISFEAFVQRINKKQDFDRRLNFFK